MKKDLSLAKVFGVPAVLAVISGIGLVTALLWEGAADFASGAAVAAPIVAIAWAWLRRRS